VIEKERRGGPRVLYKVEVIQKPPWNKSEERLSIRREHTVQEQLMSRGVDIPSYVNGFGLLLIKR
jgi:hypothetical protein